MLNPQSKIAVIVPAYNEEQTVSEVIRTLDQSNLFRDIIVVADGSDRTAEIARESGANKVFSSTVRQGKGSAMRQGALATDTPFIFFCDADLLGLTQEHLLNIIQPVLDGQVDMCVDLHDRGTLLTWCMQYLPLIGGERALKRELFLAVPAAYLEGYRVEISMNMYLRARGYTIQARKLEGLKLRRKMQKVGFWRGLKAYIMMGFEMLHAVWSIRFAQLQGKF